MKKLIVLAVLAVVGVVAWPRIRDTVRGNPELARMEELLKACEEGDETKAIALWGQNKYNIAVDPRFDPILAFGHFNRKVPIFDKGWRIAATEKGENGSTITLEKNEKNARVFVPVGNGPIEAL